MFRDCRVIRGQERTDAEPADVAAALAARAARSFVAPMTLPPSESSFAVGERINVRRDRNPYDEDDHRETWLSGVIERVRRGGKYDVQHDGGPYERGCPAAMLRKEGPGDGLILVGRERSDMSGDQESAIIELQVLNTEGKWQPARTLYEYVQQNVVEICSVWDEQNPADAPEPVDDGCEPAWWNASEVYKNHLHRVEFGPIATLLDGITPRFAGYIVEQRRAEVLAIRYFRVAAQRARVPLEVAKIIETFAGLLPAKDSVPCRRDQLPAFMQRLVEQYEDHDRYLWKARVSSSIEVRGAEIWSGYFTNDKSYAEDWTLMPRRLLAQYRELPASINERVASWEQGRWPEGAVDDGWGGPGYKTFLIQTGPGDDDVVERTFEWFDEKPWDYFLAVEHAWPPGCSIEDDVPPTRYDNHGHVSNEGYAAATEEVARLAAKDDRTTEGQWAEAAAARKKKGYAYQRSCKNAGRLLGYTNFEYVLGADDQNRHRVARGEAPI